MMPRSFLRHLISVACTLLSVSAINVQDSQAYRNMNMTRELIGLIFELSAIFLSFQMVLSFASAGSGRPWREFQVWILHRAAFTSFQRQNCAKKFVSRTKIHHRPPAGDADCPRRLTLHINFCNSVSVWKRIRGPAYIHRCLC